MKRMRWILLVGALLLSTGGAAADLAAITDPEATDGLKEALAQGAGKAVEQLGARNGFLGNPQVKIPLPAALQRIQKTMRMVGMGRAADQMVVSMNRAAEMAVKEATPLLADAVKSMSVEDARGVLTGGDDAATRFFRDKTSAALTERFLPMVRASTARVDLGRQYDDYVSKAARMRLLKEHDADLDLYVTQKSLDGLYLVMAEQERAIRRNPASAANPLVQKVFGAIGR
jgi:hypothetical protein